MFCEYTKYQSKPSNLQSSLHGQSFEELVNHTDSQLADGRALCTQDLLSRYKSILRNKQYLQYDSYTSQKLRNKIMAHYGSTVKITDEVNRPPYVYDSNIAVGEMINLAQQYKQMLKNKELLEESPRITEQMILERAANILLRDIDNTEGIDLNPLNSECISEKKVASLLPTNLKMFLNLLCKNSEEKISIKTYAFAQDIINASSLGKKRMPKNVALAMSLKSSCCKGIVEEAHDFSTVPSNIKPMIFTQAVSDSDSSILSMSRICTVVYQYSKFDYTGSFGANKIHDAKRETSSRRSIHIPPVQLDEFIHLRESLLPRYYCDTNLHSSFRRNNSTAPCDPSSSLTSTWI